MKEPPVQEKFRRTDPRYDRRLDVELTSNGETRKGVTRNLSLGGMFIEIAEPFPVRASVQVKFQVSTQPEPIEVTGEVRWVEAGVAGPLAGMGIRFHGLRARDVWALNRYFQS